MSLLQQQWMTAHWTVSNSQWFSELHVGPLCYWCVRQPPSVWERRCCLSNQCKWTTCFYCSCQSIGIKHPPLSLAGLVGSEVILSVVLSFISHHLFKTSVFGSVQEVPEKVMVGQLNPGYRFPFHDFSHGILSGTYVAAVCSSLSRYLSSVTFICVFCTVSGIYRADWKCIVISSEWEQMNLNWALYFNFHIFSWLLSFLWFHNKSFHKLLLLNTKLNSQKWYFYRHK